MDPTVAQKVVNMQHAIRKQVLNVAYADPKSPGRGGNYQSNNPPQFNSSTDYGPPSSMSRPQGPLPRYYSAPQPPAHQGYGVPDFRQGPVHDGSTPVVRGFIASDILLILKKKLSFFRDWTLLFNIIFIY